MPLFAAAGNETALVPHDEEEYEEGKDFTRVLQNFRVLLFVSFLGKSEKWVFTGYYWSRF